MPYRYVTDFSASVSSPLAGTPAFSRAVLARTDMAIRIAVSAREPYSKRAGSPPAYIHDLPGSLDERFARPLVRIAGKWTPIVRPWTREPIGAWPARMAEEGYLRTPDKGFSRLARLEAEQAGRA